MAQEEKPGNQSDGVNISAGDGGLEGESSSRRNRQAVAAVVLQDYTGVSDETGNHATDGGGDWICGA